MVVFFMLDEILLCVLCLHVSWLADLAILMIYVQVNAYRQMDMYNV